ncbi:LOW QUALITY PROTEIN: parathyroid hormone-related protein-like [Salmo salar]|uniref:LOW QUALITY PROTEIN: parathyroid hormone-related protein-like n=1 Tax=Salmo salar TaxID=8030 RepID=A0ABM3E8L0_SALSA|nr:LOW QUALITY PROTEIN: parathyroid hormone-related protein-like [Salmo salar]
MFWTRRVVQQWCFAMFLLCFPVPQYGRPIDGLTNRMKRSVTHAQLMHDKGRTLQDFKRRMWLQELLDVVHTAEIRELPVRPVVSSGAGVGLGLPVAGVGVSLGLGTTGGTQHPHPKPPGGTKNLPINFHTEEEGTNLPQETNKSQTYKEKDGTRRPRKGRKKKGRNGKRREGERREGERKRRARSLGWAQEEEEPGNGYRLEWRGPFFGLRGAPH